jgi:hypothetical protein
MNKLYHSFCVFSYKGGELCSNINQPIESIASSVVDSIDWEEISNRCADDEKFSNMSDEEFYSLTCVQLLDMLDDQTLKDIATDILYPGNTYAFDTYSDSKIYTINEEGKLIKVNVIEEPGFMEAFKKALREDAKYADEADNYCEKDG